MQSRVAWIAVAVPGVAAVFTSVQMLAQIHPSSLTSASHSVCACIAATVQTIAPKAAVMVVTNAAWTA